MRVSIVTKWLKPSENLGSRISASCECGRNIIPWDFSLTLEENHKLACRSLQMKLASCAPSPWLDEMIGGQLPDGRIAFVFAEVSATAMPRWTQMQKDLK